MERLIERCCGLDVHKATVSACVRVTQRPGGEVKQEVRTFATTTPELLSLREWLSEQRVTHVAMEATGVYWKPIYYMLEDGFELLLVNPAHFKQVPGRKTDVADCAWLAQLLEHGLLRSSFVPPAPIRELRDLTRYRKSLTEERTRAANRLHKVLQDAGIKLSSVATDMLGVSGRSMLTALVAGTTDPAMLADLARGQLRKKLPELRQALTGRFGPHHRFMVSRLLADIDYVEEASAELSKRIEQLLAPFAQAVERLITIPGVQRRTAEVMVAEIGADMSRFSSAAHLSSWAGMCPGNHESAGKRRSGKTRRGNRWLRTALGEAGGAAGRTKRTALGARYRRLRGHVGHGRAVLAVGRNILEIAYHLLSEQTTYRELGIDYFDRYRAERLKRRSLSQLQRLGYQVTLTPLPTAA
jgi:transposase